MNYKNVSTLASVIGLILGVGYIFFAPLMAAQWQIEPTDGVILFCRRIGALFLGFSIMLYLSRTAPQSAARTAMTAGVTVSIFLLAILGITSYLSGSAGPGIFISVIIEIAVGFLFARILVLEKSIQFKSQGLKKEVHP